MADSEAADLLLMEFGAGENITDLKAGLLAELAQQRVNEKLDFAVLSVRVERPIKVVEVAVAKRSAVALEEDGNAELVGGLIGMGAAVLLGVIYQLYKRRKRKQ